jgi:diguanylate cyclase (GGDEF)-like protein
MLGMLHVRCTQAISPQVRDHWKWLAMMVADSIAMTLVNVQLREQLHYQSVHDPLTGLFNRRYLDEVLEREMHKATRQQRTVSIILIDIDHFKQINDVYGHDVGDALLSAVGHLLHSSVRDEDFACRYGGEEFLLILSETSLETALKRAEYLREAVKQVRIEDMRVAAISITFSIGVAGFPDHGSTGAQVIRAADRAMRQAKADGRDRVVAADIFSEEAGK